VKGTPHCGWIGSLALVALCLSCGRTESVPALSTASSPTIVIEVAKGHDDGRTLYEVDPDVADAEPRPAPEGVAHAFDAYREGCRELSELAWTRLASGPAPEPERARKLLRVTPDRRGTRATIIGVQPGVARIVELETGESLEVAVDDPMAPLAWCRDGRHLAICEGVPGKMAAVARVVVLDVDAGQRTASIEVGPGVFDVAWSPVCTRLAVMVGDLDSGSHVLDELGELIGHGVPYYDFRLLVVDLDTQSRTETPIAEAVQYGDASLLWDEQAVTCLADEALAGRLRRNAQR
jgi:hypothetical protein